MNFGFPDSGQNPHKLPSSIVGTYQPRPESTVIFKSHQSYEMEVAKTAEDNRGLENYTSSKVSALSPLLKPTDFSGNSYPIPLFLSNGKTLSNQRNASKLGISCAY